MEKYRKTMEKKIKTRISKLRMLIATAYAMGFCALAYAMPVVASNPVENGKTLVISWLEPLVYIGMAIFGGILLMKRKMSEFLSFALVALIAVALIFYPEQIRNFLGTIITTLFR